MCRILREYWLRTSELEGFPQTPTQFPTPVTTQQMKLDILELNKTQMLNYSRSLSLIIMTTSVTRGAVRLRWQPGPGLLGRAPALTWGRPGQGSSATWGSWTTPPGGQPTMTRGTQRLRRQGWCPDTPGRPGGYWTAPPGIFPPTCLRGQKLSWINHP